MTTKTKLQFAEMEKDERSVETRKSELRARMKKRRADNENRDVKERLLTEHALQAITAVTAEKESGINVFVYLSYSSEASTDLLIETLLARGINVFCPRVDGDEMQVIAYGDDFTLSKWGIREPVGSPFDGEIDVAITPFLAVDKHGNRLGYGGGYYDRYFAKNPQTKRIAYGFDFQIVENVPTQSTDKTMQAVVTDKRWFLIEE